MKLMSVLLLSLVVSQFALAQNNILRIPEVTAPAGKTIAMPIELENTSEIVAAQFEFILPNYFTIDPVELNASRANGHEVSVRKVSSYQTYLNGTQYALYRIMVYSADNTALKGTSGNLLTLTLTLPDDFDNGAEIPIKFYNTNRLILSDREGQNVVTSWQDGKIIIEVVPRPDLKPSDVKVKQTLANPGDELEFTWKVQNVGDSITGAGWTEKLFLENETNKTRVFIGTTAYEGQLPKGASVDRSVTLQLDQYPGISGNCRPVVQILPSANCGEIPMSQSNNTAEGANYSLRVKKYLVLTPYKNKIPENSTSRYSCELRRTGDLGVTESFKVSTESDRVRFDNDGDIRFDKNTSKVYFYVYAVDNEDINVNEEVGFTVNKDLNNGYDAVEGTLYVEENDRVPLTLTLDKEDYNEGDVMKVTATVPARYYEGTLKVYLNIEQPKRFKLPQYISFEDGATTAVGYITVLQDKNPANEQGIKLTATADNHQTAEALFVLHDDDTPAIQMTLAPKTVSESAGPSAIYGTLTRAGVTDNKITVKITDDGTNDIYYSTQTLTLPEGTTTVNFPLGVRDNSTVDGDRVVHIKAAIYLTDCNCDAIGDKQTVVVDSITILDDDGPALALAVGKATVLEGDANGTTITVSRNTADNSSAISVSLAHDGTDVELPAAITIPAGQKSAQTTFRALSNSVQEGDRTVTITASAQNFSSGTAWVLISDRTLPDAVISEIVPSKASAGAGEEISIDVKVENIGAATLPAGTAISVKKNGAECAAASVPVPVAKGESYTLTVALPTIDIPGDYKFTAVVNETQRVAELLYVNNTSPEVQLSVTSLYNFTISAAQTTYNVGETVLLTGTAKNSSDGTGAAGVGVEPYIVFNGVRTALADTTDASGNFTAEYTIPDGYRGKFVFGICNPGEELQTESGSFNVYGFNRTAHDYIKHQLFKDEPYVGTIEIENLSELPLHNIRAEVSVATDKYDFEISEIPELAGNGTAQFSYTITGKEVTTGNNWEQLLLHFVCDEGATLDVTLYNGTKLHTPNLVASTTSINTTVTKGVVRNYPFDLVNMGLAETGKIYFAMPSGMSSFVSLATPTELPSLQPGDTAQVVLRFNPGDLDVNIIQKGQIGINCTNGNGLPLYFNVKVVSESKGNLRVQVQDENTIYGNKNGEKPYVEGATVRLQDYNTGATIAEGKTPDNTEAGILFENIPEGYYQLYVTADKHGSYRQNVLVSPGETSTHVATINYQAISVSWDVVETEVEDEYEIVTTLTYETQVPVPVIRLTAPDVIDLGLINEGSASLINMVARNDGLIEAFDVNFTLPSANGYTFTPLVEIRGLTLKPEQSYTIPVRITRNVDTSGGVRKRAGGNITCRSNIKVDYKHACGKGSPLSSYDKIVDYLYNGGNPCGERGEPGGTTPFPTGGPGGGGPGWDNPNYINVFGGIGDVFAKVVQKVLCVIGGCLAPDPPALPCDGAFESISSAVDCASKVGKRLGAKKLAKKAAKVAPFIKCFEAIAAASRKRAPKEADLLQSYYKKLIPYYLYHYSAYGISVEQTYAEDIFDLDDTTYEELGQAIKVIDSELEAMHDAGTLYSVDTLQIPLIADESTTGFALNHLTMAMPRHIATWSDFSLRSYVDRIMNTYRIKDGLTPTSDNYIDLSLMDEYRVRQDSCLGAMVDMGFVNWAELVESANRDLLKYYENASSNVCATVKLEIDQKLVLTRQAFRGTLTIDNDTEGKLTDIDLEVTVKNLLGEQMTSHEFQINFESIEGFEGGVDGPWSLNGKSKGVATILFIPTKYAAPDTLTTYAFGGTLYFTDGDGQAQVRELFPVSLQVKPSPELDLTYFMQRDIYGDNPLTKDVVEPIIPAEFSVLLHNKGKGDATNVRMFTRQPKIIENEKGLLVDFAIVSSSLNGGEKAMALDSLIATQFGDIPAGSCSYATWDLTSTLLGHFKDYDIRVNHVTSYGNPDLSLLDQVTIHELIHSVNAKFGDEIYRAWVCNDDEDGYSEPDHIYFSNGTDEDMKSLSNITKVEKIDATHYRLSVTVPQREWFYTAVANPSGGIAKIVSIREETSGEDLDPQNFWTTQYTMQDSWDPLPENKLHIVAYADAPKTFKFIVEFEPQPDLRLEVSKIETVPNENDIAEEVIPQLTVTFNKSIQPETFTREDIVLRYEGEQQSIDLPITMVENDSIFSVNTSGLSKNGYYVMQVKTDNILDKENFFGYNGLQVKWMLFKDGLVHYNIMPWPFSEYGDVTVMAGASGMTPVSVGSDGYSQYGYNLILNATPNEGYTFAYWAMPAVGVDKNVLSGARRKAPSRAAGDAQELSEDQLESVSTENPLTMELNKMYDLRAVFKPIPYTVNVANDKDAGTMNVATGIYDYGTVLNLEAAANDGYTVQGYVINGEYVEGATAEVTVEGNTEIEVQYKDSKPKLLLLKDSEDYTPENIELANITLQRSFRKGTWNTICLPFDVAYPGDVFGRGTLIAKLTGIANDVMQFDFVETMAANTPYLIMPGTLNSSNLSNGTTKSSVYFINGTAVEVPEDGVPHDEQGGIDFVGTYVQSYVPVGEGNYYISSNTLYYVDAAAHVPTGRYRGYFHVGSYLAPRIPISIGNVTYLDAIETNATLSTPIYDMNGRMVRKAGAGLKGLPAGVYIMGGQKFVVR